MDPTPAEPPAPHALHEYYQLHFAGRPRLTRDPVVLRQLIALAQREGAAALATLWAQEQAQIEGEQAQAGLEGRRVAHGIEEAQIVQHRLGLLQLLGACFHPAASDLGALAEALEDARATATVLEELADLNSPQAGLATDLRQRLTDEATRAEQQCAHAALQRTTGPSMHRAQACVRAAQLLQHSFDTQVAGQPGHLLRAERIEALASGLATLAQQLQDSGLSGEEHWANCQALQAQAQAWRAQGQKASAQRRQHTLDEIAHGLGDAADGVLAAAYAWDAAHDGSIASLRVGLSLWSRMDEVRRQLLGVPLIFGHTDHQHTLSTVTDGLAYVTARVEHAAQAQS